MMYLALDVRTISVQVATGPEAATEATVFLPTTDPPGSHGLLGRLNDSDRFLPVRVEDRIRLISKPAIRTISVGATLPEIAELVQLGAKDVPLRIRLCGGATIEGSVAILLPELRERPLDFLNQDEAFFALTTPEGTSVVNKDWIDFVEPAETH